MTTLVYSAENPGLPPVPMPDRFRHEISYFASHRPPSGDMLAVGEWWIDLAEAEAVLADGVVRIASPLDSASRAEIELSDEQETWLEWVVRNRVRRVRFG